MRRGGLTQSLEIVAERGGTLRLENPFGDAKYAVRGVETRRIRIDGADLIIETSPGQKMSLTRG
jgi:hypothetical protein